MRITVSRETTIGDLLDRVKRTYGTEEELEAHLDENPKDWGAKLALHDLKEYQDQDPATEMEDTREIILPDEAFRHLTYQRIKLLLELKNQGGQAPSLRDLARSLDRDKKNVSEDVAALRQLGLLRVEKRGPGRAHPIHLAGDSIHLHLLDS